MAFKNIIPILCALMLFSCGNNEGEKILTYDEAKEWVKQNYVYKSAEESYTTLKEEKITWNFTDIDNQEYKKTAIGICKHRGIESDQLSGEKTTVNQLNWPILSEFTFNKFFNDEYKELFRFTQKRKTLTVIHDWTFPTYTSSTKETFGENGLNLSLHEVYSNFKIDGQNLPANGIIDIICAY